MKNIPEPSFPEKKHFNTPNILNRESLFLKTNLTTLTAPFNPRRLKETYTMPSPAFIIMFPLAKYIQSLPLRLFYLRYLSIREFLDDSLGSIKIYFRMESII